MSTHKGWIGVDLDGTIARYDGWKGPAHIGEPVAPMVARVKAWLETGIEVRIFTTRVSGVREGMEADVTLKCIEQWCALHIGRVLAVTCTKDFGMIQLWDDRAVQVEANTGRRMDGQEVHL